MICAPPSPPPPNSAKPSRPLSARPSPPCTRPRLVSIQDNAELWLGGQKLDKGAYVAVSLYGSASSADYNRMTGLVCSILSEHLGIPPKAVYVTYHPVSDWGWNGRNF